MLRFRLASLQFFCACLMSLLISVDGRSQALSPTDSIVPPLDSLQKLYPFLKTDQNRIINPEALSEFFQKMNKLKNGETDRVVVVHLGDSHIQAGFVTQPLRKALQSEFGNAGIGVLFPYRVAKSNGPPGYVSASESAWQSTRNAAIKRTMPTGLSGFTLRSADSCPSFTLTFIAPEILEQGPSTLTIYHGDRDSCFRFRVTDDLTGNSFPVSDTAATQATKYALPLIPSKIRISADKSFDSTGSATLYGINLQSEFKGVVVHTIGVNGATFKNYLDAEFFAEQLSTLSPDLVIISLGTNEAANHKRFDTTTFIATVDSLLMKLKNEGITASIMLTTPPAIYKSYRKKRRTYYKPNPAAGLAAKALINYAGVEKIACWDWYAVMGGEHSMAKWKGKGMTDRRHIHFTSKGYGIQGSLLNSAIFNEYQKSAGSSK